MKYRFSYTQSQQLARQYNTGYTCFALSRKYHTSRSTIVKTLDRIGISRFHEGRRKLVDESVFDKITEESAYWIGFLMADGCIATPIGQPTIRLCLQARDKSHIIKFKSFLKSQHAIIRSHKTRPHPEYVFVVRSSRLAQALAKWGVTPRKSFTAKAHPALINNRHFWRGVIDGDGSMMLGPSYRDSKRVELYLVGSKSLLMQFVEFARPYASARWIGSILPIGNIFRTRLIGKSARRIICLLYSCCTVALDRKLEKSKQLLDYPPLIHKI